MLKISNLYYSFSEKSLLEDVSLFLPAGHTLGLVGPNGSGKTTLIKLISGVLKLQKGAITIGNKSLSTLTARQTATKVATVPQDPQVPPYLRAIDVVLMGRTCHLRTTKWETQRDLGIVERAMQITETWHLTGKQVYELSGGDLQRVMIARAIAQETPLMLLDEPTANLDLKYQHHILEMIKTLQSELGLATMLAIHDMNLASQYCDTIALLKHGSINLMGTPTEILTNENISGIYGVDTHVIVHPDTNLPMIVPKIKQF